MKIIWIHLPNGRVNPGTFAIMSKMTTLTFLLMMSSPISRSGFSTRHYYGHFIVNRLKIAQNNPNQGL